MKYASGAAFRRALEDRLRDQSLKTGTPLVRLRKMVAFDRFLARVIQRSPNDWVLKGGLALQLRLEEGSRTTKDIDLLDLTNREDIYYDLIFAGKLDLGDWFIFEVARPLKPTFGTRNTHLIPQSFPGLSESLKNPFGKLADEVGLESRSFDEAINAIKEFLNPPLSGAVLGQWDPDYWAWRDQ